MLLLKQAALASLLMSGSSGVWAQSFEVASFKVDASGGPGGSMRTTPGGRFEAVNTTLSALVRFAYNVRDFQVEGAPGWFDSVRYDISAEAPGKASTPEFRMMLQKLLQERLALVAHRGSRELPKLLLVAGKLPSRLTANTEGDTTLTSDTGQLHGRKITTQRLATQLSAALGQPVVDQTGLSGTYDVDLRWEGDNTASATPEPTGDSRAPSIFAAIREQLGLELKRGRGLVDVLIIESANRVPTGN